jgi:hypothetical protein
MPNGVELAQFGGTDLYYPADVAAREPVRAELRFDAPRAEAGADVPSWVEVITPRLQNLMMLRSNWNSYGARIIELSNLEVAIELLGRLMRPSTPVPIIMPTSDGSLQIEWHERDIDLEVRIHGRSRYYVTFEDLRNHRHDWEGPISSNLTRLKSAIDELVSRPG